MVTNIVTATQDIYLSRDFFFKCMDEDRFDLFQVTTLNQFKLLHLAIVHLNSAMLMVRISVCIRPHNKDTNDKRGRR